MLPALIASVASSSLQLLCTKYRRRDVEDIFTGRDLAANSSKDNDMLQRCKYGYYCLLGIPLRTS